jgi:hypothetical protein
MRLRKKDVVMKLDPNMASEIQRLAEATNSTAGEIMDMLLYIGRKALGRKVTISSKEENDQVEISFNKFKKVANLKDSKDD